MKPVTLGKSSEFVSETASQSAVGPPVELSLGSVESTSGSVNEPYVLGSGSVTVVPPALDGIQRFQLRPAWFSTPRR